MFSIFQIVLSAFFTVAVLWMLFFTDYLDSWYLKIACVVASLGSLIAGIILYKQENK